MSVVGDAGERWRAQLAAWEIPEPILAQAVDSPWVLPRTVFLRRVDERIAQPIGATHDVALEALAGSGWVLDVGAAGGATSLPLAGAMSAVTAVDADQELLDGFAERAARLGVPATMVHGRWPDVAERIPVADVVVCGNVLYNVADVEPFVAALTTHARRRVVVEIADRHPLTTLNPLWTRFHGITRPAGPTASDAIAVLAECGVTPLVSRWDVPVHAEYETFDEMVDVTRRRLCLSARRAGEVAEALRESDVDPGAPPDLGSSGTTFVTLWWD